MKRERQVLHNHTLLISSVISHKRAWKIDVQSRKMSAQVTDTLCINRGLIRDGDDFMGHSLERAQHIQAFSPCWGSHKQTTKGPEIAKKWGKDKMSRIHKIDDTVPSFCFLQSRLPIFFLKVSCFWASPFAGIIPTFRGRIPNEVRNCRTGVGERVIPVNSCIFSLASLILAGGCARKYVSIDPV
jgi:hypothetical protein